MISKDRYSRRAKTDLRVSMAQALADYLKTLQFDAGGRRFGFARVFSEWASYKDVNVQPAAAILPDEMLRETDLRLTPTLIKETWEPYGEAGWGLYQLADCECDMEVLVRAPTEGERSSVVRVLEEAFVAPGVLLNHEAGRRLGLVLNMDGYWGLPARFSMQSVRVLDDADSALKNRNEAVFTLSAQAPKVRLDVVRPFVLRVIEQVD